MKKKTFYLRRNKMQDVHAVKFAARAVETEGSSSQIFFRLIIRFRAKFSKSNTCPAVARAVESGIGSVGCETSTMSGDKHKRSSPSMSTYLLLSLQAPYSFYRVENPLIARDCDIPNSKRL